MDFGKSQNKVVEARFGRWYWHKLVDFKRLLTALTFFAFAMTSVVMMSGCTYRHLVEKSGIDYSRHIIAVDPEGAFVPLGQKCEKEEGKTFCALYPQLEDPDKHTLKEKEELLFSHLSRIEAEIKAYRKARVAAKKDFFGVLFFIHGGLNTENNRFERVFSDTEPIREYGYYPIFISWSSGPVSTYWSNLVSVRNGQKVNSMVGWVSAPLYFVRDVVRVAAVAPVGWGSQIYGHAYGFYKTWIDQSFRRILPFAEPAIAEAPVQGGICEESVVANRVFYPNADVCFAGRVSKNKKYRVLRFFNHLVTLPFKAITTPVTMSIGVEAWDNMRRRTQTLMHRTDEFEPDEKHLQEGPIYPEGTGVVSLVAKRLMKIQENLGKKKDGRDPVLPITLVGHSMGTMVINQILESYPELKVEHIVYMASAASVRDTADAVYPYLMKHKGAEFYSLVLHPYADRRERTAGGLFPSGSLLQWIDEMYGHPVTDTDRTVGKWENVKNLLYQIPRELKDEDGGNRVHITVYGFDEKCAKGEASNEDCSPFFDHPTHHGDFSKQDYWKPLFWGHSQLVGGEGAER